MVKEDYISGIDGAVRRYAVADMTIEKRAATDSVAAADVIEGYAAKFNIEAVINGLFREVILPGAFDEVLNDDIRCLFNHDPNQVLARCKEGKGTLEVWVDEIGLKYRYTTPDRSFAKDLADAIASGDVSQSSFGFRPKETVWREQEGQLDLREVVKVEILYDVSPVTYPAYQDTTVDKRSHDMWLEQKKKDAAAEKRNADKDKGLTYHEALVLINANN
ncbi:HK97 family phage prohead protease [Flavobacterium sp. NRK1]|uniref:HK97 family phage prohead protease n=1 Tax=Flavobacterium sp. NRK1 TaxID=2954929 RepID=UPI00209291BA|nr:HK97 family phage prohead protease [Flavobacterium sp. NRK1]MCO6149065.1 HK97 family phage prohead protease [Flavobacterium sp. NRK1]